MRYSSTPFRLFDFAFGVTLIWAWRLLRTGDGRPLFVAILIGVLYVGIGAFGLVHRAGDPFMGFFVALGSLLLLSAYTLAPREIIWFPSFW
jgi:hypothetical protein